MQQKVPFSLIRCSSSKVAFCSCVEWGWHIYNIVESESDPLTRRAVDLFEKEPLKGNSEVHLHTPTKFGEDRSKDLGGDREQTDRQTNRQTDKRCSIYSMIQHFMGKYKGTGIVDLYSLTSRGYTRSCEWAQMIVTFLSSQQCSLYLGTTTKGIGTHQRQQTVHADQNINSTLTLKVLVMTIDVQWEGMGDVGSARYEPTLLPLSPTIWVLSYSN